MYIFVSNEDWNFLNNLNNLYVYICISLVIAIHVLEYALSTVHV